MSGAAGGTPGRPGRPHTAAAAYHRWAVAPARPFLPSPRPWLLGTAAVLAVVTAAWLAGLRAPVGNQASVVVVAADDSPASRRAAAAAAVSLELELRALRLEVSLSHPVDRPSLRFTATVGAAPCEGHPQAMEVHAFLSVEDALTGVRSVGTGAFLSAGEQGGAEVSAAPLAMLAALGRVAEQGGQEKQEGTTAERLSDGRRLWRGFARQQQRMVAERAPALLDLLRARVPDAEPSRAVVTGFSMARPLTAAGGADVLCAVRMDQLLIRPSARLQPVVAHGPERLAVVSAGGSHALVRGVPPAQRILEARSEPGGDGPGPDAALVVLADLGDHGFLLCRVGGAGLELSAQRCQGWTGDAEARLERVEAGGVMVAGRACQSGCAWEPRWHPWADDRRVSRADAREAGSCLTRVRQRWRGQPDWTATEADCRAGGRGWDAVSARRGAAARLALVNSRGAVHRPTLQLAQETNPVLRRDGRGLYFLARHPDPHVLGAAVFEIRHLALDPTVLAQHEARWGVEDGGTSVGRSAMAVTVRLTSG